MINAGGFTIRIDQGHLYCRENGRGRPLVLIHGNMLDHRMWDFNTAELGEHFRVLRYDMRGFGKSSPVDTRLGSAVEDLRQLLTALAMEKPLLCGTSMGGVVALHFVLSYPELCAGLALVDTDLSGFPISAELARAIMDTHHALSRQDRQAAVDIWLNHPMLTPTARYPEAFELLQEIVADYTWENWLGGRAYLSERSAIKHLHEIRIPTLIVTGENDLGRFQAIADKLGREIPDCEQVRLPETAHLPNMERPDLFNELLIRFEQKLPVDSHRAVDSGSGPG